MVNPGKKIPAKITEITGITDEDVLNAPDEEKAIHDFHSFLSKADFLSGHNVINFDNQFLFKKIRLFNMPLLRMKSLDTLLMKGRSTIQ